MFSTDAGRDDRSKIVTRRAAIVGGVAAGGALIALRHTPAVGEMDTVHGTSGVVALVEFANDGTRLGKATMPKVLMSDAAWLKRLGANSFGIARQADTEMPYSGVSLNEHGRGVFRCVCCETALFSSATKFESGTGWPSFWAPIAEENVAKVTDRSLGIARTEVKCARCEGHLGHVFGDGPEPTGMRYCMNSAAMRFANG